MSTQFRPDPITAACLENTHKQATPAGERLKPILNPPPAQLKWDSRLLIFQPPTTADSVRQHFPAPSLDTPVLSLQLQPIPAQSVDIQDGSSISVSNQN